MFTYLVQRRSFLYSCYHFNVKEAFKVNNLAPTIMHHGRCHWSRALCQVSGRACSCKKDPCSASVKIDRFTASTGPLFRDARQGNEKSSILVYFKHHSIHNASHRIKGISKYILSGNMLQLIATRIFYGF